jgi:hypothetical protein
VTDFKCPCAGCTKSYRSGVANERERILKAIEEAPPAMDFFGPYISKEKLYEVITGKTETNG